MPERDRLCINIVNAVAGRSLAACVKLRARLGGSDRVIRAADVYFISTDDQRWIRAMVSTCVAGRRSLGSKCGSLRLARSRLHVAVHGE